MLVAKMLIPLRHSIKIQKPEKSYPTFEKVYPISEISVTLGYSCNLEVTAIFSGYSCNF